MFTTTPWVVLAPAAAGTAHEAAMAATASAVLVAPRTRPSSSERGRAAIENSHNASPQGDSAGLAKSPDRAYFRARRFPARATPTEAFSHVRRCSVPAPGWRGHPGDRALVHTRRSVPRA